MALDCEDVRYYARQYGYTQCQRDDYEGVLAFDRLADGGSRELVRVWWRTGTVGTYLNHPRQGKTQLFRRDVYQADELASIFANPRVHTGAGYHRVPQRPTPTPQGGGTGPHCPLCQRAYGTWTGAVSHVESGSCPSCRGAENARRQVYQGVIQDRIGYGGETSGYDPNSNNYTCPSCHKGFRQLNSLMQHQTSRPQCASAAGYGGGVSTGFARIGY